MMNNSIKKFVNGCDITLVFSEDKNPKLKNNILFYLSRCYEDRVNQEIVDHLKNQNQNLIKKFNE